GVAGQLLPGMAERRPARSAAAGAARLALDLRLAARDAANGPGVRLAAVAVSARTRGNAERAALAAGRRTTLLHGIRAGLPGADGGEWTLPGTTRGAAVTRGPVGWIALRLQPMCARNPGNGGAHRGGGEGTSGLARSDAVATPTQCRPSCGHSHG